MDGTLPSMHGDGTLPSMHGDGTLPSVHGDGIRQLWDTAALLNINRKLENGSFRLTRDIR